MTGCQGIKTQQSLVEIWNEWDNLTIPAELYGQVLSGLNFIQNWLTQSRQEREKDQYKCTEPDHSIVTYHMVENGWRITYQLTRLEMTHSNTAVLEKTKQLLGEGDLSPYTNMIIVCCCITS